MRKTILLVILAIGSTVVVMKAVQSRTAKKAEGLPRNAEEARETADLPPRESPQAFVVGEPAPAPAKRTNSDAERRAAVESPNDPSTTAYEDLRDLMHLEVQKAPIDTRATRTLGEKLSDLVTKNRFTDSEVRSVKCVERLCEAEVVHTSQKAYASFMQRLNPHDFEWPGERFATPGANADGDGPFTMKVFFAREGASLPRLD